MSKRKLSFKWFGSLSNSNTRHSSDKTDSRHDGKRNSDTPVGSHSVDDMESCLHSPGYVRSADMYSHVGTVPRKEKHTSTRKKKGASKAETIVGQSQCLAGDYVRESPLLTALSATSLPCLDRLPPTPVHVRPLPLPPSPVHSRPLPLPPTSPTHSPLKNSNRSTTEDARIASVNTVWSQEASSLRYADPSSAIDKPSEMAAVNIMLPHTSSLAPQSALVSPSRTQDLYMVMDPIASQIARGSAEDPTEKHQHLMRTQETSKPPEDSQEVELETLDGQHDAMDSSGEYVKFSKEKFWLERPTENLRKELEEELKLNSCNLRSHGWYYGRIPWEVSESLVVNHGDFIIRDSLSSQGDYVLTSHWNHHTLHFLISKSIVQSSETYTRVQYKLEGEAFDSLPSLVNFYVGSRAALTQKSQAQIHSPVNRTLPLRYLETAFSLAGSKGCVVSSPSCQRGLKLRSGNGAPLSVCPWSPSTFHHREAANNSSLNLEQSQLQSPNGEVPLSTQHNTSHQSKSPYNSCTEGVVAPSTLSRCPSGAQPRSAPDTALHRQCNDKLHNSLDQELLPADIDGNSYTELYPGPPSQSYVERLCAEEGSDRLRAENGNVYFSPVVETVSAFRPSRYQSQLMPKENKPLEVCILRRVKELLVEIDPRTAARHITKADCMVARILDVSADVQRSMGVSSGMELLTLPHGHQLRLDLLERFHTMSIMLAVDVLGCTGTTEERASLLHKTIQIAAELKTTLGNMFGFAAIMRALELPQVSRLEQTWTVLRQRHTEGAILYEKTLKPFMKSLNDGKESCPLSNTSFPHVVPLLTLLEKSVAVGEGAEPWETVEASVDVVMCHLGAARTIAQLGGIYHSNAQTKLHGVHERPEVLELFLTEFQMRLLWGSRGAEENQAQRYAKFDQVLTALSNKLEPPIRPARPF